MTTRELYTAVINTLNEYGTDTAIDLAVEVKGLVAKMDASNEKRKSADSKEKRAVRERLALVRESLTNMPQFADNIAETLGLSIGQVRSALTTLVHDGVADKSEVKVGKTRKMAYTLHIGE